jgi:hypothetical protein
MVRFAAALLLLVTPAAAAFAQSLPVPSHWKDAQGSEINLLTIDAKGALTGKVVSHAPGFACANFPFDLSGRAHGHHVQFSVVWKNGLQDCKAQTAFSGKVAGKSMHVWWVTTSGGKKTRGADTFVAQ